MDDRPELIGESNTLLELIEHKGVGAKNEAGRDAYQKAFSPARVSVGLHSL